MRCLQPVPSGTPLSEKPSPFWVLECFCFWSRLTSTLVGPISIHRGWGTSQPGWVDWFDWSFTEGGSEAPGRSLRATQLVQGWFERQDTPRLFVWSPNTYQHLQRGHLAGSPYTTKGPPDRTPLKKVQVAIMVTLVSSPKTPTTRTAFASGALQLVEPLNRRHTTSAAHDQVGTYTVLIQPGSLRSPCDRGGGRGGPV